jgi:hypothetical protein
MTDETAKPKIFRFTLLTSLCDDIKAAVTIGADVADSIVLSGLTFFTTLAGASIASISTGESVIISGVSAGLQFFTVLAIKRGLVKSQQQPTPTPA